MAKKAIAALAGTVSVSILSLDFLSGLVVLNDDGSVTITFKKPRSPKMITRRFAAGQFITATEGEEGSVSFMGMTEALSVEVEDINAIEVVEGIMTVTDAEGETHVIDTRIPGLTVEVEGEAASEAAPAKAKGKAKEEAAPAKGKGKGKAKEEEAEEADEADEEEEKPKAKAGKGKAKEEGKAKGGKGKKDDDWE
jgi:hypothetical protein